MSSETLMKLKWLESSKHVFKVIDQNGENIKILLWNKKWKTFQNSEDMNKFLMDVTIEVLEQNGWSF